MNNPDFEALFEKGLGSWPENSVFVAAVSGGSDSAAMLTALVRLAKKRHYHISCLHIRHNIRSAEESEADTRFVRGLCQRLEVPCRIVSIKPGKIAERAKEKGIGIEAAAREYRQAAYRHEVKRLGAQKVVTAHHKDDVLENILMRILRGSGPRGLASMPSSTHLVLRPLLHISKDQILSYLDTVKGSYQTDLSNRDNRYLRNRVRNVLIPFLDEHFPHWKKGIESLGETQSYIADYAEEEARKAVKWQICENGVESTGGNFAALNPVIQEEAVFQGIKKLFDHFGEKNDQTQADVPRRCKVPKRSVLRRFFKNGRQSADLGKIRLQKNGEKLRMVCWDDPLSVKGGAFCAEKPGIYQFMGYSIKIEEKMHSEHGFFCELPLIFRSPLPGEKISSEDFRKMKTNKIKNSIIVEDINGKIAFLWLDQYNANILLLRECKTMYKTTVCIAQYSGGFDERKQK